MRYDESVKKSVSPEKPAPQNADAMMDGTPGAKTKPLTSTVEECAIKTSRKAQKRTTSNSG